MKTSIALVLVVVSLTAAQSPRFRPSARQQDAPPYKPSGWRPQGESFSLPQSQPQQSYGPPPTYGPPAEEPTTVDYQVFESTEPAQIAKINTQVSDTKASAASTKDDQKGAYYVVLPQSATLVVPETPSQNLVYAFAGFEKSAKLVAIPQATLLTAPLTTAKLQSLPVAAPVATYKTFYSPISAPYTQLDW